MRTIAEVERDALATYFATHWTRAELAGFDGAPDVPDPGHGRDEICPVTFFGLPFDPSKDGDLAALSTFAVAELRGFPRFELEIADGEWIGQTLGLTSPDGLAWVLAAPAGDVAVVPQADLEDGATVTFLHGVDLASSFTASVAAGWIHGVGFVVLNIAEIGAGAISGRGYYDTGGDGTKETRIRLSLVYACPPAASPRLAEQYAGATAALFAGVALVRNSSAAEGTLELEMSEVGLLSIRQHSSDHVSGRANHIGDERGWRWYLQQIVLRRTFRQLRAGRRTINAS